MGRQHNAPAMRETQYPFFRRLGGPQGWYGHVQNISPCYTIYTILRPKHGGVFKEKVPMFVCSVPLELFHQPTLMQNFLYSLTICLLMNKENCALKLVDEIIADKYFTLYS